MAALLGISFRSWQDYEAGKSIPGGKVFESLAKLGFNVNWLLTGEGPMRQGEGAPGVYAEQDEDINGPGLPVIQDAIADAFRDCKTKEDRWKLLQMAMDIRAGKIKPPEGGDTES